MQAAIMVCCSETWAKSRCVLSTHMWWLHVDFFARWGAMWWFHWEPGLEMRHTVASAFLPLLVCRGIVCLHLASSSGPLTLVCSSSFHYMAQQRWRCVQGASNWPFYPSHRSTGCSGTQYRPEPSSQVATLHCFPREPALWCDRRLH